MKNNKLINLVLIILIISTPIAYSQLCILEEGFTRAYVKEVVEKNALEKGIKLEEASLNEIVEELYIGKITELILEDIEEYAIERGFPTIQNLFEAFEDEIVERTGIDFETLTKTLENSRELYKKGSFRERLKKHILEPEQEYS